MCQAGISLLEAVSNTLATDKEALDVYVISKTGQVYSYKELNAENIPLACFTPSNDALADIASPSKKARVTSAGGTAMMFKFAEAQSAVTFVLGSTVRGQSKYGGKQLYYTPHGSSLGKNFLQRNQAPKRKDAYVAARALAANRQVTGEEIKKWQAAEDLQLMNETYGLLASLPAQTRPAPFERATGKVEEDIATKVALSIMDANAGRKRSRSNVSAHYNFYTCLVKTLSTIMLPFACQDHCQNWSMLDEDSTVQLNITCLTQAEQTHIRPCTCRQAEIFTRTSLQQVKYACSLTHTLMRRMGKGRIQTTWRHERVRGTDWELQEMQVRQENYAAVYATQVVKLVPLVICLDGALCQELAGCSISAYKPTHVNTKDIALPVLDTHRFKILDTGHTA